MIFRKNKRPLIPSRNPKVDGISLSPSRARQILQIHRETRKQPHECLERGNVALRSGLYKLISWPPRGDLHYRHQNGKVCCKYCDLNRESNIHSAPSSRSRVFAPAPSASPYSLYNDKYILFPTHNLRRACMRKLLKVCQQFQINVA